MESVVQQDTGISQFRDSLFVRLIIEDILKHLINNDYKDSIYCVQQ